MSTETQPQADEEENNRSTEHLSDVDDGCGCTEIWERLTEIRTSE